MNSPDSLPLHICVCVCVITTRLIPTQGCDLISTRKHIECKNDNKLLDEYWKVNSGHQNSPVISNSNWIQIRIKSFHNQQEKVSRTTGWMSLGRWWNQKADVAILPSPDMNESSRWMKIQNEKQKWLLAIFNHLKESSAHPPSNSSLLLCIFFIV